MKGKKFKRAFKISAILTLVFATVFAFTLGESAEVLAATVSDPDTSSRYSLSLGDNVSTQYAGRIWSDKSVFTDEAEFELYGGGKATVQNDDDFLVAYSALATSQNIKGKSKTALDVVFVIDISGSMVQNKMSNGLTRFENMVDALNSSVESILSISEQSRVGVIAFNGTSTEVLPLDRYTKYTEVKNQGRPNQSTTIHEFFTASVRNGGTSGASGTITTRAVNSANQIINKTTNQSGGTNIQKGIAHGLSLLKSVNDTTVDINGKTIQRMPTVILLSDGEPTSSSDYEAWWNMAGDNTYYSYETQVNSDNSMKVLMTAAYMKDEINRNYAKDGVKNNISIYTVGVGLEDKTGDARDLAEISLDPQTFLTGEINGTVPGEIYNGLTQYLNGQNPKVDGYTFKHPPQYDFTQISDVFYNDKYLEVKDSGDITEAFSKIVDEIALKVAEVPTRVEEGETIDETGHIKYVDPIGQYMKVKEVKEIIYYGVEYKRSTVENSAEMLEGTEIPVSTRYIFNEKVTSPIYGERNLNEIDIIVTREKHGNEISETMTIDIPASVIPVRVNTVSLNADGSVSEHTNNGALPIRVLYTVGLQERVLDSNNHIKTDMISHEYILENTNEDGTLNFYSNLFTGENTYEGKTMGNTTVTFEPSHSNPFYFNQENITLYVDEECTQQVSSNAPLDDNTTYYFKDTFYHANHVDTAIYGRTGAQLKKTDIINIDGYWYREAGSPRLNRIMEFEGLKIDENNQSVNHTQTAEEFYLPTFVHKDDNPDPFEGKFVVYLGNNGKLSMPVSGTLSISKDLVVPEGLSGPNTDREFNIV